MAHLCQDRRASAILGYGTLWIRWPSQLASGRGVSSRDVSAHMLYEITQRLVMGLTVGTILA